MAIIWGFIGLIPSALAVSLLWFSFTEAKSILKSKSIPKYEVAAPACVGLVGVVAIVPSVVCFLAAFGVI